jgi:hypothetical protein
LIETGNPWRGPTVTRRQRRHRILVFEWGGSVLLAMEWARTNKNRGLLAAGPLDKSMLDTPSYPIGALIVY